MIVSFYVAHVFFVWHQMMSGKHIYFSSDNQKKRVQAHTHDTLSVSAKHVRRPHLAGTREKNIKSASAKYIYYVLATVHAPPRPPPRPPPSYHRGRVNVDIVSLAHIKTMVLRFVFLCVPSLAKINVFCADEMSPKPDGGNMIRMIRVLW